MDTSSNNGPLMAMTLAVGLGALCVTGVLSSILVAVLVGALGKAVDVSLRALIARRESYWRREAQRLAAELSRIQRSTADPPTPRLYATKRTNAESISARPSTLETESKQTETNATHTGG